MRDAEDASEYYEFSPSLTLQLRCFSFSFVCHIVCGNGGRKQSLSTGSSIHRNPSRLITLTLWHPTTINSPSSPHRKTQREESCGIESTLTINPSIPWSFNQLFRLKACYLVTILLDYLKPFLVICRSVICNLLLN